MEGLTVTVWDGVPGSAQIDRTRRVASQCVRHVPAGSDEVTLGVPGNQISVGPVTPGLLRHSTVRTPETLEILVGTPAIARG